MFEDELGLSLKGACASSRGRAGRTETEGGGTERSVPEGRGQERTGGGRGQPKGARRARAVTWMGFNEEQL